jgi:hypothetical protein
MINDALRRAIEHEHALEAAHHLAPSSAWLDDFPAANARASLCPGSSQP